MDPLTLVVMEWGSAWPRQIQSSLHRYVALDQERGEPYGALLRRTYDDIRKIERQGGVVTLAALSCNDGTRHALEGRVPLARTLLAALHGTGRLLLVASSSAPDRTRHSLTALAQALTEGLAGTSASVSTLFGAHEISFPRSGRVLRATRPHGLEHHPLDKAG